MFKLLKIVIFLALVAALLYFGHPFLLGKAGRYLEVKDELKPADVIVVLAGEETERVEHGVKLFNEGWARKDRMILAGGPAVWKYTWASLMKEHAVSLGVSPKAILLEEASRSTEEDALFTKEILRKYGYRSVILVTSPYHSRRAAKIFRKILGSGVKVIISPGESWLKFDDWWKRRRDRAVVLSEYSKFLWLLLFDIRTEPPPGGAGTG
jgi:uncharacterized SAM-binding protein YcdF (DUF218 family)